MFSAIFSSLSFFLLMIPLNPLILNIENNIFFDNIKNPIICLFILLLIPAILFSKINKIIKLINSFIFLFIFFIPFHVEGESVEKNIKVAVIQVGLYYEMGGNTTKFFDDLYQFLIKNKDLDIIVFSENVVYGHKSDYNKKLTDKLMSEFRKYNIDKEYALFLNLHGYTDINNIITLLMYKGGELINQKQALIPFIEKNFQNDHKKMNSKFLYYDKRLDKKTFRYKNFSIDTYICYDALFPRFKIESRDLVLVQSDYKQLDRGSEFDRILLNGSKLSWFSTSINSGLFINVQNYGGTVVIRKKTGIDKKLFHLSKETPFFIVTT
ncbi:apolipoprotein acyltransferase [Escherichia coli]